MELEHISKILPIHTQPTNLEKVSEDVPEYTCKLCKDGYWVHPMINGKPDYSRAIRCKCVEEQDKKARWESMLKSCQLPGEKKTLNDFRTRGNASLKEALNLSRAIAQGSETIRFLTLMADTNRGKSHLAKAICYEWIKRGVPARYGFVPALLRELKDGFDLEGEDSYRIRLHFLLNVPLLVLDDLGTERATSWGLETLQSIINHRYENLLHLVVTTNKPLDEIVGCKTAEEELASQRISSRLKRENWCRVLLLDAPPYDAMRKR